MDENGVVYWQAAYLPFGEVQISVATVENNLRFPGQYFDAETGLHYNWNRYYDPTTGRYISADPIGLEGGLNLYGYAEGDPLNWIDPYGLQGIAPSVPGMPMFPPLPPVFIPGTPENNALVKSVTNIIDYLSDSLSKPLYNENTDEVGEKECDCKETNPFNGPVEDPVIAVDPQGNAIPVGKGEQIKTSPDDKWLDVKDQSGRSTGIQIHGPHKPATHGNHPEAMEPHAHRPGDPGGNHWLPLK